MLWMACKSTLDTLVRENWRAEALRGLWDPCLVWGQANDCHYMWHCLPCGTGDPCSQNLSSGVALRAVVIPAFIIISHSLGVTEATFLLLLISKL